MKKLERFGDGPRKPDPVRDAMYEWNLAGQRKRFHEDKFYRGVEGEDQEKFNQEKASAAAKFWADCLYKGGHPAPSDLPADVRAGIDRHTDIAATEMPIDVNKIRAFESALAEIILDQMVNGESDDPSFANIVKIIMDYEPDDLLIQAADQSGISFPQLRLYLPFKTIVEIRPGMVAVTREGTNRTELYRATASNPDLQAEFEREDTRLREEASKSEAHFNEVCAEQEGQEGGGPRLS